jgi:hypothetical protein
MHARISSRSLNGEDVSRMSSARRWSSARTNSRGLASPKQPGAAAPWMAELLTTLHRQLTETLAPSHQETADSSTAKSVRPPPRL